MRKAPREFPGESSCLSASFLPIFPKYHLLGKASKSQTESDVQERFNQKLAAKYAVIKENEVRYEEYQTEDAEYVFVALKQRKVCSYYFNTVIL